MTSMIADKTRAGLMGPNHVRRLARVESIVKDPLAFTDIEPTLDLDFTDIKGAPFAGNLTRATVGGYRMNSKGVMVPTVANEPVIDFGTDGKPVGTGFWGAYTNLLLRSEEFDNAAWTKAEATITANAVAAPDGNTTADKIVESVNNSDHSVRNTTGIATGVATCTFSVFAKAAERSQIKLVIYEGSNLITVGFDLLTETVLLSTPGGKIETVGNGWYRCSVTVAVVTGVSVSCFVMPMSGGVSGYLGNGTSGIYVWGAQLTATAFPVPYVPTTSAAVARNADSMVVSGADFTDFFNPVEGTIYVDAAVPRDTSFPGLFQIDDLTTNNRFICFYNGAILTISVVVAGVVVSSQAIAVTAGAAIKLAASFKANRFEFTVNGTLATPDTVGALPTGLSRLKVGLGDLYWNSHIRRLIYWPKALPAAELQRMTA